MATEKVVLVDETGRAIGSQDKATIHHAATPLHLAFSSYVFDEAGRLLLTQRAFGKRTWPGVWTNSCCGHPLPGEPLEDAVRRRLSDELGLIATQVDLVLPAFRYRAEMPDGVVENELCPVYRVTCNGEPTPDPDEVAAFQWTTWAALDVQLDADGSPQVASAPGSGIPEGLSPWCLLQVAELRRLGDSPGDWPVADPRLLPPAAQLSSPGQVDR